MANPWLSALKKWNAGQPKWTIPKKGTAAHAEVKRIASGGNGMSNGSTVLSPPNGRRRKKRPVNGRRTKRPVGRPRKKKRMPTL